MREALKLALEALEILGWQPTEEAMDYRDNAITAIKEALAQPEQKPVTWRNAAIRVGEDLCSVGPFGYYDMTAEQWLDWALSVVTVHAPPQRKPFNHHEFGYWWFEHGSGLHPLEGEDQEQHAYRVASAAWQAAHGIKE